MYTHTNIARIIINRTPLLAFKENVTDSCINSAIRKLSVSACAREYLVTRAGQERCKNGSLCTRQPSNLSPDLNQEVILPYNHTQLTLARCDSFLRFLIVSGTNKPGQKWRTKTY